MLGIDPGTTGMGYALLDLTTDPPRLIAHGLVLTPKYGSAAERLVAIADALDELIATHAPVVLALERHVRDLELDAATHRGAALGRFALAHGGGGDLGHGRKMNHLADFGKIAVEAEFGETILIERDAEAIGIFRDAGCDRRGHLLGLFLDLLWRVGHVDHLSEAAHGFLFRSHRDRNVTLRETSVNQPCAPPP